MPYYAVLYCGEGRGEERRGVEERGWGGEMMERRGGEREEEGGEQRGTHTCT